jgi:hypothetical protein
MRPASSGAGRGRPCSGQGARRPAHLFEALKRDDRNRVLAVQILVRRRGPGQDVAGNLHICSPLGPRTGLVRRRVVAQDNLAAFDLVCSAAEEPGVEERSTFRVGGNWPSRCLASIGDEYPYEISATRENDWADRLLS